MDNEEFMLCNAYNYIIIIKNKNRMTAYAYPWYIYST